MDEYIKRGQAIKESCDYCNAMYEDEPCEPSDCLIMQALKSIPAADVRPVVTCGECEYWEDDWIPCRARNGCHYCPVLDLFKPADWFCAEGKKREGE